jgi:2-keto-4-pentenoate hydratase/2-oxohepta-3-ene-1,7-dioic acid hydratase in catechol pathway
VKLISYQQNGRPRVGAVHQNQVIDLSSVAESMQQLIEMGTAALGQVRPLLAAAHNPIPLADVHLLAPIPSPRRNVICLGLNYREHAKESYGAQGKAVTISEVPIVFTKATTAVCGPYDDIPYDPAVSTEIDWEVELGVIIGRQVKNVAAEEALAAVFGYTVINDISARDLQRLGKQFFKGKSLDGSCPTGPWIVTADELLDPHQLRLTCRVNDTLKQDGRTDQMIFDIPSTIAYLSRGMTLLPGDIIATGTPDGVGFARTPPEFLQPGDVVACEIEGIGVIRNTIATA